MVAGEDLTTPWQSSTRRASLEPPALRYFTMYETPTPMRKTSPAGASQFPGLARNRITGDRSFRYVAARALTLRDDNRGSEVNPITA